MTTTTTSWYAHLTASGVTPLPFFFQAASEDEVGLVVDGVEIDPSAYSVTLNGDGTGFLTPLSPLIVGDAFVYSRPAFTQPATFARFAPLYPDQFVPPLDRLARGELALYGHVRRALRTPIGEEPKALPTKVVRAGKFLAFDTAGEPIAVDGTGGDAFLQALLASTAGAGMIGTTDGATVQEHLDGGTATATSGARRLSYGPQPVLTDWPGILDAFNTLPSQIVGFGGVNTDNPTGTTGGAGYDVYYMNNPSLDATIVNSFGWALEQVRLNGGGNIGVEPMGFYPIILDDRMTLKSEYSNMTIWAPGRNLTFWSPRTKGIFNLFGKNHIYCGVSHRPLPGPINLSAITNETVKGAKSLVQASTETSDLMAWISCDFDHPSWHCLDMTRVTDVTGADPYRSTVQWCTFRNAIQSHLIGTHNGVFATTDPTKFTRDDSPRQCFVTFYQNFYAYNLQRNPKALGNAYIDFVGNFTILRPYQNEYLGAASDISEDAYGGAVQDGGWLRYRGNLIISGHPDSDGKKATFLSSVPQWGGDSGRLSVEGSYAENLIFETKDAELIDPLPYDLPHDDLTAMTADERAAWVADLLAKVGARPDAAPEGVWVPAEVFGIPDGQIRVIEGIDRNAQLRRIDQPYEYALPVTSKKGSYPAEALSYARHLGRVAGVSTNDAIGPTMLDLANPQTGNFTVLGDAGTGQMRSFINTDDVPFTSGMKVELVGSSVSPTTLKAIKTVTGVTTNATTDTVTIAAHGMSKGDFPVVFTTSGTMPGGLTASKTYYVAEVPSADTVKLALTYADATALDTDGIDAPVVVDITSAGTGSLTARIGNLDIVTDLALDAATKAVVLQYYSTSQRFIIVGGRPS